MAAEKITLYSGDEEVVFDQRKLAARSIFFADLFGIYDEVADSTSLRFDDFKAKHLNVVREWIDMHVGEEMPERTDFHQEIPDDDLKFFRKLNISDAAHVLLVADFFLIVSLAGYLKRFIARVIDENNGSAQSLLEALDLN